MPPALGFKPIHQPAPHYRDLAAGAELRGTAHTGVPLVPWHNFTGSWAIIGTRTNAVLEIGYYDQPSVDAKNAKTAPRVGPDAFRSLGEATTRRCGARNAGASCAEQRRRRVAAVTVRSRA